MSTESQLLHITCASQVEETIEASLGDPFRGALDDYLDDRATGAFLVIDPASGATLAAGLVGASLQPHRG